MMLATSVQKEGVFQLMERVLFLKNVDMFKNIDTERLIVIAKIARDVTISKGEDISKQDEIADTLYIVKNGSLRVIQEKDDRRTVLRILGKGECFGIWGLFGNHPRSNTAQANEDCNLLMIHQNEFKEVLYENPEIAYNILEMFGELLRSANNEIVLLNNMVSEKAHKTMS